LQTYKLPSLDFEHVATRFTLPVRAVAFSPCGEKLAAAGDDDGIKLVTVTDQKVGPPYVRGVW
jgi:chromosome transmission fidelity protein 4